MDPAIPRRIVGLKAENFKRLKVVEINADGLSIVPLTGANASGKTSILDAIWAALGGAKVAPEKPIRTGQSKARIEVDLGDLKVVRSFTEKGTTLTVEGKDGATYKSPQAVLDGLLGQLCFDPLAFANSDPKAQAAALKKIVKLDVDVDALDLSIRRDFEERTVIGRDLKAAQAYRASLQDPGPVGEERSMADLIAASKDIQAKNEAIRTEAKAREALATQIQGQKERLQKLRDEVASVEAWIQKAEAHFAAKPALEMEIDMEDLQAQVQELEAHNQGVRARAAKAKEIEVAEAKVKSLDEKQKALTAKLEATEKAKMDALASAVFPIPGLGFLDGAVTFNGVPFSQASAAEALRVSTAIAMAANPSLRVIRIADGSLMDRQSREILAQMAETHGYQIWVELVDESGKVGVYLEDGGIVADNLDHGAKAEPEPGESVALPPDAEEIMAAAASTELEPPPPGRDPQAMAEVYRRAHLDPLP